MIEKPKRPKQLSNQERKIPANIQELITRYDLDNTGIYDYLDKLNSEKLDVSGGDITGSLNVAGGLSWNTYSKSNVNYNDFKKSGHYYLGTNCTNAPDGLSYVRLIVNGASGSTDITQIAIPVGYNRIYIRTCSNNTWKSWERVTTLDSTYPVGSIYMSVNSTNPSQLFGGTWQQIKNVFLLGAGDISAGTIGGEANHTLASNELPKEAVRFSGSNSGNFYADYVGSGGNFIADTITQVAHNNMPPYLAVYMWKRIQ